MKTNSVILALSLAFIALVALGDTSSPENPIPYAQGDLVNWIRAWAAIGSLIVSFIALTISICTFRVNKNTFRRQGAIHLFTSWKGMRNIDPANPITPDIVQAVNVLSLTADYWNNDIVLKSIIYHEYWEPYRDLYDILKNWTDIVPGLNKTGKEMLTKPIVSAFADMLKNGPSLPIETSI